VTELGEAYGVSRAFRGAIKVLAGEGRLTTVRGWGFSSLSVKAGVSRSFHPSQRAWRQ
jgi:hypothetical protein